MPALVGGSKFGLSRLRMACRFSTRTSRTRSRRKRHCGPVKRDSAWRCVTRPCRWRRKTASCASSGPSTSGRQSRSRLSVKPWTDLGGVGVGEGFAVLLHATRRRIRLGATNLVHPPTLTPPAARGPFARQIALPRPTPCRIIRPLKTWSPCMRRSGNAAVSGSQPSRTGGSHRRRSCKPSGRNRQRRTTLSHPYPSRW